MKNQTLNEEISRIKSVMGILTEAPDWMTPTAKVIIDASSGAGTNEDELLKGFKMIKSWQDYQNVEKEIIKFGYHKNLVFLFNDEYDPEDTKYVDAVVNSLRAVGIDAGYKYTGKAPNHQFVDGSFFVKGPLSNTQEQSPQLATNGWWDKYSSLVAHMNEYKGKVHYPLAADAQTGAIAIEKDGGVAHDFFPDGRWYQYGTVEEGLNAVVKPQYEGKWRERNGVLVIDSKDGETWTSNTKKWVKRMQWKPETGSFPLMYGQYGPTIQTLQKALGLKGDKFFGPTTEKYILTKAPEYKRETGVTDDIYNKIVNAAKPAASTQPATPPPPTEAELQANPSTLNPY
jgi:hypothetical protein